MWSAKVSRGAPALYTKQALISTVFLSVRSAYDYIEGVSEDPPQHLEQRRKRTFAAGLRARKAFPTKKTAHAACVFFISATGSGLPRIHQQQFNCSSSRNVLIHQHRAILSKIFIAIYQLFVAQTNVDVIDHPYIDSPAGRDRFEFG